MNIFKFVFESRGPLNLVKRTGQVASRFGLRPGRMGKRFERFMDLLDRYHCRPTFPITALPMSRNPNFSHRLIERGAELAVHAYTHTDLTTLSYEEQSSHMGKAIALFREHGVPFSGFRAPYLHWNEDTMRVVEDYRFRYSSNEIVLWNAVDLDTLTPAQREGWEKGRAFYKPHAAEERSVLPTRRRGFIEIPVSLPDDEILLDRMYIHDVSALVGVWQAILDRSHERGELFTVQLHPERIDFLAEALGALLTACREKPAGVWVATLGDIATWWRDKAMNAADFVGAEGRQTVSVRACKGSTLYLRESGSERPIEPGVIHVDGDTRPCVGVSPGSAREAIQMLQDRGYIIEIGEASQRYAIHLGLLESLDYVALRRILERLEGVSGPLVRFGTWPHGTRSALAVTGDIDALTLWDFLHRFRGA